jgi:hypothetical protein
MNGVELYRHIKGVRADTGTVLATAFAPADTAHSAAGAGIRRVGPGRWLSAT